MTDTPIVPPQDNNTESTPPSQAQNSEHMIPKTRFDEVNNQFKELKAQLEQLQTQKQQQAEQELAEQNKWQELAEQRKQELERLQTVQESATRYQTALQATNESRIASVPEDKRTLIPEYDDPVKLGAWLDKNLALIVEPSKPTPPSLDGGSGGSGGNKPAISATHESIADIAKQYGYSVDKERIAEYAKQKPKTE